MAPLTRLVGCLLLAAPLLGQPTLEEWKIERYEWRGEAPRGTTIELINLQGDIRVRSTESREVYLLANIQRHRDDPRRPEFRVQELEKQLRLQVLYPAEDPGAPISADWGPRRVDVALLVPESAPTVCRTRGGLVEIKGLEADVVASSESGDIIVRAAGRIVASTDHGSILAQFRRSGWSDIARLETVTGEIRVELPRGGRADIELETRGEITTDFSIRVERVENSLLKRATAEVGDGGSRLSIKSNRGAIKLLSSTVPEEPKES